MSFLQIKPFQAQLIPNISSISLDDYHVHMQSFRVRLECLSKRVDQVGVKRNAFEKDALIEKLVMIVSFVAMESISKLSMSGHRKKGLQ